MKSGLKIVLSIALLATLAACGKYNYSKPVTEEAKKADKRVWGVAGGEPLQLANQYPDDPSAAQKADEAKKKLYADYWGLNRKPAELPQTATPQPDTTAQTKPDSTAVKL